MFYDFSEFVFAKKQVKRLYQIQAKSRTIYKQISIPLYFIKVSLNKVLSQGTVLVYFLPCFASSTAPT